MRSNKGRQGKTGAKRFYRPNGDNVKLPHELWRAPLWTTANQHTLAKAAERDCVRHIKNSYGDIYRIYAKDLLRPSPDMSVLLSLIALCQKKHAEVAGDEDNNRGAGQSWQMGFTLPITELYDASGIPARHRCRLIASMERLSSVQIEINRSKPIDGQYDVCMSYLFKYKVIGRRSDERCDVVHIELHRSLEPRNNYLFKSSRTCAKLKNDTAKLLFWFMASRQHIRLCRPELYQALIPPEVGEETEPTAKEINEWASKRLHPAIKELEALGWRFRHEHGMYTIHTNATA